MRKCFTCNKEFDDSVDFCPTCGARLINDETGASAAQQPEVTVPQPAAPTQPTVNNEPVTVGEWMVLLVNLIPCVGPLVYFIIMLVWAFGDNAKPSKKTFGKANLIIYLVSIGLGVIVFLFMLIVGFSLPALFDSVEYYNYY